MREEWGATAWCGRRGAGGKAGGAAPSRRADGAALKVAENKIIMKVFGFGEKMIKKITFKKRKK
jgi:hypothetical protein